MELLRENISTFLRLPGQSGFKDHIPIKFWGHCVLTTTYIINLLPNPVLHGKSPHKAFHNSKPTIQHVRVLGCLCFAKNMYIYDKFQSNSVVEVHMGYSATTRGYILYSLNDKKFFLSRDVEFREFTFPFAIEPSTYWRLFPTVTIPSLHHIVQSMLILVNQVRPLIFL